MASYHYFPRARMFHRDYQHAYYRKQKRIILQKPEERYQEQYKVLDKERILSTRKYIKLILMHPVLDTKSPEGMSELHQRMEHMCK